MTLATPAYRWNLVPVLTSAGFVSGIYTEAVIRVMSYGNANPYPFTFFGSLSFGLTLCAVLWAFGFVPSRRAAATLVALTIAVHLIGILAIETRIVAPLIVDVELPVLGSVLLGALVEHWLVALALYSSFLLVLIPVRPKLWTLLVAQGCAILTVVVVFSPFLNGPVNSTLLSFTAQTIQACFLAVAIALSGPDIRTPHNRFALVFVQIGFFIAVYAGTNVFVRQPQQASVAQANEEIGTRVASAPSRINLPPLNQDAVERVLLMEGVGEWQPHLSNSSRLPAEQAGGVTFAPRPERISYNAYYSRTATRPDDPPLVSVHVTQYPNAEWARFDVLNSTGQAGLTRLSQFGNTYYQNGPYLSWSSRDRLIVLDCSGCTPPVIDEFLKAYLAKYPSDL